jgi:hypothetical protein
LYGLISYIGESGLYWLAVYLWLLIYPIAPIPS